MPNGKIIVYRSPDMADLAQEVVGKFLAANHHTVQTGTVDWGTFPDGTPNIMIKEVDQIRNANVILILSLKDASSWVAGLAVAYALPRYLAGSFTLVVPFYPTGTMERVDDEGQVATAMTLARMLSAVPMSQSGPSKLVLFDVHALQTRFYFQDSILPCFLSAIPTFLEVLKEEKFEDPIGIAFPDEGARKRFYKFFKDYPQIVCSKRRVGDQRIIEVSEGDCEGKHIIIVDDMVQTGGTLIECANAMIQRKAAKVSVYATHGVFPDSSWKRFTSSTFTKFFIANTVPLPADLPKDKFHIISVADELVKFIVSCVEWTTL